MAGEQRATGALKALLIALPFALVLAWSLPTRGPSRAELAQALSRDGGRPVAVTDVRSIDCRESAGGGYDCRWQQHEDDRWRPRTARFSTTAQGWHVVGNAAE